MLRKLVARMSECAELPVEIEDIRDALVSLGVQDKIEFRPVDTNPEELKGLFYKYIVRPGVYADPVFTSWIIFSKNMSMEWQRVVCCKELVHVCEDMIERTNTEEEVAGLLEKILGPLSTEDWGLADFQASLDRLALYQCLPLIFPDAARKDALAAIKSEKMTLEEVAEQAWLPVSLVKIVLDDNWPEMVEAFLSSAD